MREREIEVEGCMVTSKVDRLAKIENCLGYNIQGILQG